MPVDLQLWLTSRALFRQASYKLMGSAPPKYLKELVDFESGLSLHLAEGLAPPPNPDAAAFLDSNYFLLNEAAGLGWRTVWFNTKGAFAPEAMPIQDADLDDLQRLTEIGLALAAKPSLAQCLAWWEDWEVPGNIRAHSQMVARSAYILAALMRRQGVEVDPILAYRGGLLHDIDKIQTLHQSGAHGQQGADFLEEQGYPALAEIVREHIMSTILHPDADERPWEVKLVYYCDKLVEDETLVPFDQRLSALFARYPQYRETMGRAAEPVRRLGDQICSILSIPGHEKLISNLIELQNN
jgi:putative nucleotidyltransferase with HDIG domain